jgi:hypothetical protein
MKGILLSVIIFLGMTTLAWSQESLHQEFDRNLASYAHGILLKVESGRYLNKINYTGEYGFLNSMDSLSRFKILRAGIISKAQTYIGVRYRYGQSSEKGFDCSGFVRYIYGNFGFDLPHSSYIQYRMSRRIDKTQAQPGDLVFFVTRGNGASHVGIYLGNNQFIHSPGAGRTVSIDSLGAAYYKTHLYGFGSVF